MDQPFDRFFRNYERPLENYAKYLRSHKHDLLVAISRKAPRLIQLIDQRTDLPSVGMEKCVCEKALPFIAHEVKDKNILLTDDSLIFGSTFARIDRELHALGAKPIKHVLAMSNAANKFVSLGVTSDVLLEPTEIAEFIDLEIQAFGSLAIPYDVDHPLVTLSLSSRPASFELELRKRYAKVQQTTTRWQAYYSLSVFGLTPADTSSHSLNKWQYGPSRIRFFVDHFRRQVVVVGIFCLCLSERDLMGSELFADAPEGIRHVWLMLSEQIANCGLAIDKRYRALANAAHHLAGVELIAGWLQENRNWINRESAAFAESDLRLLWGPKIGRQVKPLLNNVVNQYPGKVSVKSDTKHAQFLPMSEISTLSKMQKGSAFLRKSLRYLSVALTENPSENLSALFEAQRAVFDDQTRHQGVPDSDRLEIGLSYSAIEELLKVWGSPVSEDEFAAWRDKAIDHGTIVPRYAPSFSQPDLWLRVVRCGENLSKDAKVKLWLDYCLKVGIAAYRRIHSDRNQECLPWFLLEKVLVTIRSVMATTINNELDIDTSVGYDEFGARVVISNVPGESFLVDYATQAGVFLSEDTKVYRKDGPPRNSRAFFRNPQFGVMYSEVRNPLSPEFLDRTAGLINAFFAIDSLFNKDQRTRTVLAITTCATEDSYLSAISKELELWLFQMRPSISAITLSLLGLPSVPDEKRPLEAGLIVSQLGRAAGVLLQTNVKKDAFHRRSSVIDDLDQVLKEDGPNGIYASTWNNSIKRLLEIEPTKNMGRERYILFASALGKKAISIVLTVLNELGLTEDARPLRDRKPLAHHVESYNRYVSTAQQNGFTCLIPPPVEISRLQQGSLEERLRATAEVLEAARAAVLEIWTFKRYPQPPSVMQLYEHDVAVLLYDLVDSSKEQRQLDLQGSIHDLNDRIKHETTRRDTMGFYPDQDDGNAIVCRTVSDAVELFRVIAETASDHGYLVKASIESTVGGEKLLINTATRHLGGRTYQLAARVMAFFKEATSQTPTLTYVDSRHKPQLLEQPDGSSYLLVSDHALAVLQDAELSELPKFLQLQGVGEKFAIRAVSALPTKVHCYSIKKQ